MEMSCDESWVSLMDYAAKNDVSLSTLRRYIKAGKVRFKIEGGRYLLWDESGPDAATARFACDRSLLQDRSVDVRLNRLETELKNAREEIAELKMLVAIYEERMPSQEVAGFDS